MSEITPAQFRGARAMLGWSKLDLAKAASVSLAAVMRAEGQASGQASPDAKGAIRGALESAGVRFTDHDGGGAGVMLSSSEADLARQGPLGLMQKA